MSSEEKLGVVEIIKIVNRLTCAELDALYLSSVYVVNILSLRSSAAELEALPGVLEGLAQLAVEK